MTGTRFRTVTDVVEASGPAGSGGLVVTGNRFRAVPDVAGASGPAGGPVVTGSRTVTKVAGTSSPAGTGGPVVAGVTELSLWSTDASRIQHFQCSVAPSVGSSTFI